MITSIQKLNRIQDNDDPLNLSPLALTALAYLDEALEQEHYEIMTEIIRYAKEFGAEDYEIDEILRRPFQSRSKAF